METAEEILLQKVEILRQQARLGEITMERVWNTAGYYDCVRLRHRRVQQVRVNWLMEGF